MEEITVIYGTYNEIKEWYNNLDIEEEYIFESDVKRFQFKSFDEQIKNDDEHIGRIQFIIWFEADKLSEKHNMFRLVSKKICLCYDIDTSKLFI